MGRKEERTRYFVGDRGGYPQLLMVAVDIGSPADRAAPETYRLRNGWDSIRETDLMGYAQYLRDHPI